jgi:glycosyltransferase involved in cell wall biosynthesis
MRIGIDMLGDQSAGRTRGVGRYTRGLVTHLVAQSSHDVVLYYHEGLPRTRQSWPRLVETRGLPGAPPPAGLYHAIERLARLNPDALDLLLLTCPLENYEGYLPPFPARGGARLAAIVYDLIPLVFPTYYLRHPALDRSYQRALEALRQYDLLLTISAATRRDVMQWLGMRGDRVVNIGAASEHERFFPERGETQFREDRSRLRALAVREPFVYGVSALDFRKNLTGLLAAFELLPPHLRDTHQLVLTCAGGDDAGRARELIARSAVADRVLLTGPIDDEALAALYRRAAAFVFPSRYEGFGLPLLEAMQCGAVVVAGDNSSQVEVVGDAGLLADVDDAADLANRLARLLEDRPLAHELRRRASRQAQSFAGPQTARRAWNALERSANAPRAAHWLQVWAARGRLAMAERLNLRSAG